jgi:hypothetical protein
LTKYGVSTRSDQKAIHHEWGRSGLRKPPGLHLNRSGSLPAGCNPKLFIRSEGSLDQLEQCKLLSPKTQLARCHRDCWTRLMPPRLSPSVSSFARATVHHHTIPEPRPAACHLVMAWACRLPSSPSPPTDTPQKEQWWGSLGFVQTMTSRACNVNTMQPGERITRFRRGTLPQNRITPKTE